MTRLALWLLALMLLVSGSLAFDDYVYDEEAEEEVASSHVPVFSSRARQFDVRVGENVTLPCLVDHLGATILVWEGSQLNGIKVFFVGTIKQEKDPRFTLEDLEAKGNSMIISGVRMDDAGTYTCKVANNVALTHTVNVQYAPTVDIIPKNGVLVASKGSPATLQCMADGNPKPTVTWTRKGGLLPNGNKKMEGMKLVIPSVESSHMGAYTCTVSNGIGETIVENFRLEVTHAPEIEVATKKVHSGAGYEAQLICNVHGEPLPEVSWRRVGDAPMDVVRHRESREGAECSLNIDEVHDSDLGQYTCRARNTHGTAAAIVELTGQPKEVMITSEPHGQGKDSYTLRWNVESYAPIEEYKVIYKKAQMESGGAKEQKWEQITVPAPPKDGSTVIYAHMHVLNKLTPGTAYEAVVTAKNKYGWSDEPEPFKLYTFKARDSAADLIGGEALGSTDPNTAGSVRSGALAVAAALGALLAVL